MAQHFLLSKKARTLSLAQVLRLSDDEAAKLFASIRWAETNGEPVCHRCGGCDCYTYATRKIFKCKACGSQFSVTSGTIFASRKLPVRVYLAAIAIFMNGAKGISALQMTRDLNVQYKTAFVMCHKLREAMAAEQHGRILSGDVEIDGAYFGGHIRQENRKEDRIDRRFAENQTGKRKVVVVMRQRGGKTIPMVFRTEFEAHGAIAGRVAKGSTVHADESTAWDALHARFAMTRINHQFAFSDEGACTNQAESYFSRLRRAEIGTHHRIGVYLHQYASEMAWREDHRRTSNGAQFRAVTTACAAHPVSRNWKGYWQRSE
jgi:transposase-like protein